MTYLDDADIRRQVYQAFAVRATTGEHDNRPLLVRILELRREKARLLGFANFADLVLEDRMAHTGDRALGLPGRSQGQRPSAASTRRIRNCTSSAARSKAGEAPELAAVGRRLLRREAAQPRSTISTKRRCAPISRWSAWWQDSSNWSTASTASGWKRNRRPGLGPGRALLQHPRRRRAFPRRLLRRLVSAREQARRRLDGQPDHRRPRRPRAFARTSA